MSCKECNTEMELIADIIIENGDNLIAYRCSKCIKVVEEEIQDLKIN